MEKKEDRLVDSTKILDKAVKAVKRDASGNVQWDQIPPVQGLGLTQTGTFTDTETVTISDNAQVLFQKWVVNAGVQAKTIILNTIAGGATSQQTSLSTTTSTTKTFTNRNTSTTIKFQIKYKYTGISTVQTPFVNSLTMYKEDRQGLGF